MGDNIDLKELLSTYTKHWLWFVLTCVIAVLAATIYLRYATPKYMATAKIQILEEKNAGLNLFQDSDLFNFGNKNVLDEIELIRSRSNFIKIVEKLDLNTQIKEIGNFRNKPIYKNPPFFINFFAEDSILNKSSVKIFITLESQTSFGYSEEEGKSGKVYDYGERINTPVGEVVLTPNLEVFQKYKGKDFEVDVIPVDLMANNYRNAVSVTNDDENSSILSLYLKDAVKQRASDILNELILIYNQNAINDKRLIADRTRDFINERISNISSNLTEVDQSAEDLRTNRNITDIDTETSVNINVGAVNRQELASARNELNMASGMRDIIDQQEGYDVLPTNIGNQDPTIANATAQYNNLVQERKRLLKNANEKNPVVVNIDQQLLELKRTLKTSLNSSVNNLELTVNTLSNQQAIINSKLYANPSKARALRDITRRQQTTEELYLYLLKKREEAQVAVASTSPKCKVIDYAYWPNRAPVSPRRKMVYLASLLLGLLIPFSIIYTVQLLDNKVHNMKSLEKITKNVPILGELPKLTKKQLKASITDDRSVLSESLRIFRTNLDYLIKTNKTPQHKNNIVFVTSSISGEGKTFFSSNIALILASAHKKVLLLGADVRNPKIYDFFALDKKSGFSKKDKEKARGFGLTDYLFDESIQVDQIVNKLSVNSNEIDVIYSGRIPPNPAELLLSPKIEPLINSMSDKYDYVIVDTAPLMVVTDTLLISQYADHLIYVTRAGVTETKAIDFPIKLQEEGKIKGLAFVVNDVAGSNLGYGGMYGYGYGRTKKKWWKLT